MEEGIFALAGVIVGGVVTGVVAVYLERRRERRDAAGARLIVEAELAEASKAVQDALDGEKWPPGWKTMRWSQSWSTYRPVLAATTDKAEFAALARAYLYMELLHAGLAEGERDFSANDATFVSEAQSFITEADRALAGSRG